MHFEAVNDLIIKDNIFVNYLNLGSVIEFGSSIYSDACENILISGNTFTEGYYPSGIGAALIRNSNAIINNLTITNHLFSNCSKPLYNIGGNISNNIFYKCEEVSVSGSDIFNNIFRENIDCDIGGGSKTRIHDNIFENNTGKIEIGGRDYPHIFDNIIKYNNIGFYIEGDDRECLLYNNLFYKNSVGGSMVGAPNAVVWGNRFIENDIQAESSSISHRWYGNYPMEAITGQIIMETRM